MCVTIDNYIDKSGSGVHIFTGEDASEFTMFFLYLEENLCMGAHSIIFNLFEFRSLASSC